MKCFDFIQNVRNLAKALLPIRSLKAVPAYLQFTGAKAAASQR
jgi:hypothetical protein